MSYPLGNLWSNGWIDVTSTEMLPLDYVSVLIWRKNDGCSLGYLAKNQWFNAFDIGLSDVIAWQALPFGPEGEALISRDLIRAKSE